MDVEPVTEARSAAGLYGAYRTELVRFATALVGRDDASDVVSDAMESLLRGGRLADAENPVALMYRAVYAKAKSMHRSVFRRRTRERRFAQSVVVEDPELRPDVVKAVVRLSPQKRACVYLTYWEDLAPVAVADRLGIGEGTVKKYLARARAQLREVLDE
ncbi:MAG: RNA polymerase sigma factor [Acidimicrobiia bacterium]|nr:RNA polymerase sigma factor [Acidimicrobiia bacterium]